MPDRYDVVIVGSGFGAAATAHVLVHAGARVLMLERGDWARRGPGVDGTVIDLRAEYSAEAGYRVEGEHRGTARALLCVGGLSTFFGGVALRMREADLAAEGAHFPPQAAWPLSYADLEPYYTRAERLLGVAGHSSPDEAAPLHLDPTAPWRSDAYPLAPPPLSALSARIAAAATGLGLRPFRLPLAIHYGGQPERVACHSCTSCDGFACPVHAKNDAAAIIAPLLGRGLTLATNTVATKLVTRRRRVEEVQCVDRLSGEPRRYRGDQVVIAAGTLGTAHVLLASGLHALNPAGGHVGRHLMRHCNGIVFGAFPAPVNPDGAFHKQVGLHDHYFDPASGNGHGRRLGSIQQVHSPPLDLVLERAPRPLHGLARPLVRRLAGLLVIAEDEPRSSNRVELDARAADRFGMPRLVIHHRYSAADRSGRATLLGVARGVLRAAGARAFYVHTIRTFSHALGTVRMGDDARTAPLDQACRFRGIDNLRVSDGSCFPRSGGVNPSLTICANALRTADLMVDGAWSSALRVSRRAGDAGRRALPVLHYRSED